jgi:hypothetical protein
MTWHIMPPLYTWLALTSVFTIWFWAWKPKDKLTTLLILLAYILFNLYCGLNINWALANYYLIALPFLLSLTMIPRTLRKFRYSTILGQQPVPFWPSRSPRSHQVALTVTGIALAGLCWLMYGTARSYFYGGQPVLMFLPVRNGIYAVANGGNGLDGFGMNNFLRTWYGTDKPGADRSLGYGAAIYKLKALGNPTERSGAPNPLTEYAIFNDIVYAPCFGQVVYVEDGHPDVPPYAEPEISLGNYLVLQCNQFYVTVGHLKKETILFKEGDEIRPPMQIARVGNSGYPAIPHLHVHVTTNGWQGGDPVPILFDGWLAVNQFPVRNKFFIP